MAFIDELKQRNPELFTSEGQSQIAQPGVPGAAPQLPIGAQQLASTIEAFMPMIEQTTGLTRREIFLQMLKTGSRGGGWLDVLTGLAGTKPAPEAKFVKYVKTLAIWVPVAFGLTAGIVLGLFILLKAASIMLGGL